MKPLLVPHLVSVQGLAKVPIEFKDASHLFVVLYKEKEKLQFGVIMQHRRETFHLIRAVDFVTGCSETKLPSFPRLTCLRFHADAKV